MNRWTEQYLDVLRMEKKAPTYEYLQSLVEAHLHQIPFEIVSKFHYFSTKDNRNLIPTKDEYLENVIKKGWGGNCYILNIHFRNLLEELGFDARIVRARGGNPHLGLMVTVDGQSYYTDVGYMAPLFEPLVLEEEPCLHRCGEEILVKRLNETEFMIDRRSGGHSFVTKTIEWAPVPEESFQDHILFAHRDEADNPFMRRIVVTIYKNRVSYSVINTKLIKKSDKAIQVIDYGEKEEWIKMMESTFNLKRADLEFVINFLRERSNELFPEH